MAGEIEFMRPNGLFVFHTILDFEIYFTLFYFVLEMLIYIFKGFNFPIERHSISVEICCLIFYLIINLTRIYFGKLGNRAETSLFVMNCLIFNLSAIYTHVQFLCLSTYVLRIEVVLNGFGLAFCLFEFIAGIMAMLSIKKQEGTM
ncbi:MAG: transmembrane 17 domain-containing protein [archaeon]|nr:transmembrane 17 domain-containing protein [archaeon]